MKTFTKEIFLSFYNQDANASECWDLIINEMTKNKIELTNENIIGIMGVIRVEVGRSFLPIKEIDGEKKRYSPYFGRGYIQITWYDNYLRYLGLYGVENPDIALDKEKAAFVAVKFFTENKIWDLCAKKDWMGVRRRVNGGYNGLTTFLYIIGAYYQKIN